MVRKLRATENRSRTFTGRNDGVYFVGLLMIL
ncbi:uncharacterized protein METZ01_LOCUS517631, partial [marine metagenome]